MLKRPLAVLSLPLVALSLAGCAGTTTLTAKDPETQVVAHAGAVTPSSTAHPETSSRRRQSGRADTASAPKTTDATPADSSANSAAMIAAPSGDLFERLRTGFQLEDVDQPAIDRELNWFANNPAYLERVWGRAELYMHYIVEELDRRKMPRELALLPVIESAFEPYAYSKASAAGLWQFIPGTGTKYGLKQDWWYDGRRDVVEATRAALDYLQALHEQFDGDWLLAIAAYNCGEGNVVRAVGTNQRSGQPIDFWHLKLPAETRAYVPKLLAMRRIVAAPADYGLEFSRIPDIPHFTSVQTGGQIDLQVAADIAGITKDELYELNPAFHRWATDPNGPHSLLVPTEVADGLEAIYLSLSPEQRMRVAQYTVKPKDTVASVARANNTSPELLRELNGLGPKDTLAVGDMLRVPSSSVTLPAKAARAAMLVDNRVVSAPGARRTGRTVVHVVRSGDTLTSIAKRLGTDTGTLARLNDMKVNDTLRTGQRLVVTAQTPAAAAPNAKTSGSRSTGSTASSTEPKKVTYTVRRGDTLYSVARLLQVTVSQLLSWNKLAESVVIKPGQRLVAFVSHG